VIIEDGLPVGEGQINRSVFMDELGPALESKADELLGLRDEPHRIVPI
jgi:hypothetical protein